MLEIVFGLIGGSTFLLSTTFNDGLPFWLELLIGVIIGCIPLLLKGIVWGMYRLGWIKRETALWLLGIVKDLKDGKIDESHPLPGLEEEKKEEDKKEESTSTEEEEKKEDKKR